MTYEAHLSNNFIEALFEHDTFQTLMNERIEKSLTTLNSDTENSFIYP